MIDLQVSRKQIDEIDSQIVKLFEERMKVANEVAKYKMETGKAVFDKEREEQKLDSLSKISHGKFNERAVRELFSQIMSISRKYQYGVLPHTDDITDFEKTEKAFDKEQAKVYYFGVPGTHTQQAMEDVFGEAVQGISCQSFQGVMEAVENGQADYGVLPIENSSTGGISTNYDLLLNYKNAIVGEYVMKIDQCLLALPGTKLEDIQTVFSHPQGLLQSRKFMKEHPLFEGVEYGSTAAAAKKVAQDKDKTRLQAGVQPKNMDLKLLPIPFSRRRTTVRDLLLSDQKKFTQKRAINSRCALNYRIRVVHCTGFCPIFFITI